MCKMLSTGLSIELRRIAATSEEDLDEVCFRPRGGRMVELSKEHRDNKRPDNSWKTHRPKRWRRTHSACILPSG